MDTGDKVAIGFFSLGMALAMTVWFNWIATNDAHMLTVADCMVKMQKAHNVSPQEAFIACEKEERR